MTTDPIETIRTILVNHHWDGGFTPTLTAARIADRFGLAGTLNVGAIAQAIRGHQQEGFLIVAEEVYRVIEMLRGKDNG